MKFLTLLSVQVHSISTLMLRSMVRAQAGLDFDLKMINFQQIRISKGEYQLFELFLEVFI